MIDDKLFTSFLQRRRQADAQSEQRRPVAMDCHPFGGCRAASGVVQVRRDVERRRPWRAAAVGADRQRARRHNALVDHLGVVVVVPCSAMVVVVRIAGDTDTVSIDGMVVGRDGRHIVGHSRANAVDFECRQTNRMGDGLAFLDDQPLL